MPPVLVLAAAAALLPAGSSAARTCPQVFDFQVHCTTVTVPLDRSGRVPGRVRLSVARVPGITRRRGTILVLAGGPGQAAVPLSDSFVVELGDQLIDRDLVTFDERGTGGSGLLRCPALERLSPARDPGRAAAACAAGLGPRRAFYTTQDSVGDIEDVRRRLGIPRLTIYAVSYGTKLALAYAAAHPDRVQALVLNSLVLPEGPDALSRPSLAALPRALAAYCARRSCAGITRDPFADLSALVARLRSAPLAGFVVDGHGRRHGRTLGERDVLQLALETDADPIIRSSFPAGVHAALAGDPALLLRELGRAIADEEPDPRQQSTAVFAATTCEEDAFPWRQYAPLADRPALAAAATAAVPDSALAPFSRAVVVQASTIPLCLPWPPVAPPAAAAPQPPVRTLVLSGTDDLRTPPSDAVAFAGRQPGVQVVTVGGTGHDAVGGTLSSCPTRAISRFLAGGRARSCAGARELLPPHAVPPTSLRSVAPLPGTQGRRGRTAAAALLTFRDASATLLGSLLFGTGEPSRGGGLRGGFFAVRGEAMTLHRVVLVPGVEVSGRVTEPRDGAFAAEFVVTGTAARGALRIDSSSRVAGVLDGRAVRGRARPALGAGADAASAAGGRARIRLARRP